MNAETKATFDTAIRATIEKMGLEEVKKMSAFTNWRLANPKAMPESAERKAA